MQTWRHSVVTVAVGALLTAVGTGPARAAGDPLEDVNTWYYPGADITPEEWNDFEGWTVQSGVTYYDIDDDEGRFREDRYYGDDVSGGVDRLTYRSENLEATIRAVFDEVYGASLHYVRPDQFRIDFEVDRYRKYYDGSNEPWNPALYLLPASFAENPDEGLFADRLDLNLEGTLLLPDLPHVVVGWHHWERDGQEVLLRGSRARVAGDPVPRKRSIPAITDMDGESDTLYVEVPFTLDDKYNFSLRGEYETYRDKQLIVFPRYNNGALEQFRTFADDPAWEEWRALGHFDSFITDDFYLSANYYHSTVKNQFDRDVVRPGSGNPFHSVFTDVDNDRDANVLTLGMAFLNVAEKGKLQTAFRVEHGDTDSDSLTFRGPGPFTPVRQRSSLEETRLGESAEFVWKGVPRTTLSLAGEWEQRYLKTKELADVQFHELNTDFTVGNLAFLQRDANIHHTDQEYTLTAVNRPRRDVRLTGRYRFAQKYRDYDEHVDLEIYVPAGPAQAGFYPGVLGDMEQKVHEITLKGDWRFLPAWNATAKYQYENDEIEYDIQTTEGQDLEVHRVSGTIYGTPCSGLTLTGMGMVESYDLQTPTVVSTANILAGSDWAPGTSAFDYTYDAFVLFASANYAFNEKWHGNCAYQHTQNNGKDVENKLNELWLGVNFTIDETKVVHARYEYIDFEDELGNGFDDYDGHGVSLTFAARF